jgi:hypothetical protein
MILYSSKFCLELFFGLKETFVSRYKFKRVTVYLL